MEEFLPLWNDLGQSEGLSLSRTEVHRQGLRHPVVHVWVFDPDGRFLIAQRAVDRPTHPGLWDVSCAGHMTAGQTPGEAAVRELKEELGLRARAEDLIFKGRTYRELILPGHTDREFQMLFALYLTQTPELLAFDPGEVAAVRWLKPGDYINFIKMKDPAFVPQGPEYLEIFQKAATAWS